MIWPDFIPSVAFFSGLFIGKLIEKRKSDRKFAGLIADRLMGKPSTKIVSVDSGGSWTGSTGTMAGIQQQLNANIQHQLGVSHLWSLLGNSRGFLGKI